MYLVEWVAEFNGDVSFLDEKGIRNLFQGVRECEIIFLHSLTHSSEAFLKNLST